MLRSGRHYPPVAAAAHVTVGCGKKEEGDERPVGLAGGTGPWHRMAGIEGGHLIRNCSLVSAEDRYVMRPRTRRHACTCVRLEFVRACPQSRGWQTQ
eukprot:gene13578-biopygen15596